MVKLESKKKDLKSHICLPLRAVAREGKRKKKSIAFESANLANFSPLARIGGAKLCGKGLFKKCGYFIIKRNEVHRAP